MEFVIGIADALQVKATHFRGQQSDITVKTLGNYG
jgi:hypothetical protein